MFNIFIYFFQLNNIKHETRNCDDITSIKLYIFFILYFSFLLFHLNNCMHDVETYYLLAQNTAEYTLHPKLVFLQ